MSPGGGGKNPWDVWRTDKRDIYKKDPKTVWEKKAGTERSKDPKFEVKAPWKPVVLAEGSGAVWKAGDSKTFVSFLGGSYSVKTLQGTADLRQLKGKLTVIDAKASGSVLHGQVDFVDKIRHLIAGAPIGPLPSQASGPQAARVGDLTTHGIPLSGGPGSPNVIIGGKPAWRATMDFHTCPLVTGTMSHGAGPTLPGSSTVLINGAPAARAGDFVMEAGGGPDTILVGCPTVLIGPAPSPKPPPAPKVTPPEHPWVIFESTGSGDAGTAEAHLKIDGVGDLKKLHVGLEGDAGAEIALLKGELPLKVRIRIPFTTYYVGLGVKAEGTFAGLGGKAEGHFAVNPGDGKVVDIGGGAKVTAGIGAGVHFALDVSQ